MTASEYFPPVEIDRRPEHPDIVFFQDRLTRYTIACDAESRAIVGASQRGLHGPAVDRVLQAVRAFQRKLTPVAAYRKARRENE